jgi:hypothetical protein
MKPRYDKCLQSLKSLHLVVQTINVNELTDEKQIKAKHYNNYNKLYKISIDLEYLKLNLNLNTTTTPICEAYRFDRITNDDRYHFRLGNIHVFEPIYNHELIVNEHGFYRIYCRNQTNGIIFNEIK